MFRRECRQPEWSYENEPANHDYQRLYDELLDWFHRHGPAGQPNLDALVGDDAMDYVTTIRREDASRLFQVPAQLARKNPRDFSLILRTPHRFDFDDIPRQVIIANYHFGDHADLSATYFVDGLITPDGMVSWDGSLMTEGDGVEVEETTETMDHRHFNILQNIITAVTVLKS